MKKYTVEFCVIGAGYRHIQACASAAESVRTAGAIYAALAATLATGDDRMERPLVFNEITRGHCSRVSSEPRNRAFFVAINKRG